MTIDQLAAELRILWLCFGCLCGIFAVAVALLWMDRRK